MINKTKEKSYDLDNKNIMKVKSLNNTEDSFLKNKLKKKKINSKIKLVEIDLNQKENKINLTKSMIHTNPFNKIYTNTYTKDINKRKEKIKK